MNLFKKPPIRDLEVKSKFKGLYLVVIFIVILTLSISPIVNSVTIEPGSDEDPLVSKSYVDFILEKLVKDFDFKLSNLKSEVSSSNDKEIDKELVETMAKKIFELTRTVNELSAKINEQEKYLKFEVVELEEGQIITLGESSEVILRGGRALAISGDKGDGLADITTDGQKNTLYTDDEIPLNHLLLISRDDGRGVKAITKMWLLVKGSYVIQEDMHKEQMQE